MHLTEITSAPLHEDLHPINLLTDDLPHDYSRTEWWYFNTHVKSQNGDRQFALFLSFFKKAVDWDDERQAYIFAYSITWALSDLDHHKYYRDSILDPCAPKVGMETIDRGDSKQDSILQEAIYEVFSTGQVPRPDRLSRKSAYVSKTELSIEYEGNTINVLADGSYQLHLEDEKKAISIDLNFLPQISPVRHGNNGTIKGSSGEDMNYYFIPKNRVEGHLKLHEESLVLEGSGWYDHEFSCAVSLEEAEEKVELKLLPEISWNWVALQLSNNRQLSAYDLFEKGEKTPDAGHWLVEIDGSDGAANRSNDFSFTPLTFWKSTTTFLSYPVSWRLEVPSKQIDLLIEAVFPEQEFITLLSEPAFWEGSIRARGTYGDEEVEGQGYIEVRSYEFIDSFEDFLKSVTKETRKAIDKLIPLNPSKEKFLELVASPKYPHLIKGLDQQQYVNTVIKPIRELTDRGGKCWRSYATLCCIDMVGGNSQEYMDWLAWSELLHTGSLIVDDVQDESTTRRGGPACHITHGISLAINAGNAAYFIGQTLLFHSNLTKERQLELYQMYFETMRAAHAGQAMDINSFYPLMDQVVETGNIDVLEERILSVHLLKSATPAGMLARFGASQGGGTKEQIQHCGHLFETLGLAFQIMDDVLNLRGFEKNLKNRGEDISAGKITIPVAKAMAKLPLKDRKSLWNGIKAKPQQADVINGLIDQIEACGALDDCVQQAKDMVEEAWKEFQLVVPRSYTSVLVRAFAKYVLSRHY